MSSGSVAPCCLSKVLNSLNFFGGTNGGDSGVAAPADSKPAPLEGAACPSVKRTGKNQVREQEKRITVCSGASLSSELVEQDLT